MSALTDSAAPALPPLKWVGGKRQLLDAILPRLLPVTGRYFEPFIGGGAVFFALRAQTAVIGDLNGELVSMYRAIRGDVEGVIRALGSHINDADHFYKVRALDWTKLSPVEAAARTIFLNKTCFNGLYRVNGKGGFNTPFGRYKNPTICDAGNLRAVSRALASATIDCCDFEKLLDLPVAGDTVYFDPPYAPLSSTANFTGYQAGGFDAEDQARLAKVFRGLAARGVRCLLSNSDTPEMRALYEGFTITTVSARRAVNSKASLRGPVNEILVDSRSDAS